MHHPIDEWILKQTPDTQALAHYLRDFFNAYNPEMEEVYRHETLFFLYKKRTLCYFHAKKNYFHIGFADGYLMPERPNLLSEGRTQVKVFKIVPGENIDIEELSSIINVAMELIEKKLNAKKKN